MLPLPPMLGWTFVAVGAAAFAKVLVREWRRVNAELDAQARASEPVARERVPTLRRDPHSGVYRPE